MARRLRNARAGRVPASCGAPLVTLPGRGRSPWSGPRPGRLSFLSAVAAGPAEDGYLRVTWGELCAAEFAHLCSGLDPDEPRLPDSLWVVSGYTEWVSGPEPLISLGWDWRLNGITGMLELASATVRSNLMLIGQDRIDLGCQVTEQLLSRRLSRMDWQPVVASAVGLRQ